jgi:hypothetical protein
MPRPEYPRPQLRRQDWTNLNGEWSFAFDELRWLEDSLGLVTRLRSEGLPLVGYTWWPLFSLLDWAYREGEEPAEEYLWRMGMYDLEPDGKGNFRRIATPVVWAFRAATERTSKR